MTRRPSSERDSALRDAQRGALVHVAEIEAEAAQVYAKQMRLRAEMDALWNGEDGPEQFGVMELAGTARIGQARAGTQLIDGSRLVQDLPRTLAKLETGEVFVHTAVLLLELTRSCAPEVTREVESRLIEHLAGMSTSDARRLISETIPRVEADLDPVLTEERLDAALAARRVWTREVRDGMVEVGACLDGVSGARFSLDFDELCRAQRVLDRRSGVRRTNDELRAHVFAQMPSRLLALVKAIQRGEVGELVALAATDPGLADQIEALAAEAPPDAAPSDVASSSQGDEPAAMEMAATDPLPGSGSAINWGWGDPSEPAELSPGETGDPDEPAGRSDGEEGLGAELCLEPPAAWTGQSFQELVLGVLRLKLREPAILNVHVAAMTLLEQDNRVARVDGGAPLPASHVRWLAPSMTLRRILVDPWSGTPIAIDPELHPPVCAEGKVHEPEARPDGNRQRHRSSPRSETREPWSQEELRDAYRAFTDGSATRDAAVAPHGVEDAAASRPLAVRGEEMSPGQQAMHSRLAPMSDPYLLVQTAQGAHDPSPALREFVNLRDQRCSGIGCSHPACRSQHDHEIPYPAGPTAPWNIDTKSARCHRAKHRRWTVHHPREGPASTTITWTSPLGHSYTKPSPWTGFASDPP